MGPVKKESLKIVTGTPKTNKAKLMISSENSGADCSLEVCPLTFLTNDFQQRDSQNPKNLSYQDLMESIGKNSLNYSVVKENKQGGGQEKNNAVKV